MELWTLWDTLAFLLLLSLLLPSLLIMFIPLTFKRHVLLWKALNSPKTSLMVSMPRLKPLNSSRLPCVYAPETLSLLLTQKTMRVKNCALKE
ncbi:gpE [Enterobacteria phage ID18]|uniref:GPE n=1 Tax=Enterobacteria phage ID18 TaxID=384642 RepID=Q2LL57_9VIRU|nr:gpE [Enterobacteria phage ID18]AAZ49373.1 gpE [Enterobacteria phage ID18]